MRPVWHANRGDKDVSPPSTPLLRGHNNSGNVSSSSSDDGSGGRKTSPLSSMRPRGGVASSVDAYHRYGAYLGAHMSWAAPVMFPSSRRRATCPSLPDTIKVLITLSRSARRLAVLRSLHCVACRDFEDGMSGHVFLGEHSSTHSSRTSSISGAQAAGSSNASQALCRVS